jgi:hypothetical protein
MPQARKYAILSELRWGANTAISIFADIQADLSTFLMAP